MYCSEVDLRELRQLTDDLRQASGVGGVTEGDVHVRALACRTPHHPVPFSVHGGATQAEEFFSTTGISLSSAMLATQRSCSAA